MIKYANIVFLQNEDDFTHFDFKGFSGFSQLSIEEQCNFLQQWDDGDYWDLKEHRSAGTFDIVIKDFWPYIITINNMLGYAGLERAVEVNEDNEIININPLKQD